MIFLVVFRPGSWLSDCFSTFVICFRFATLGSGLLILSRLLFGCRHWLMLWVWGRLLVCAFVDLSIFRHVSVWVLRNLLFYVGPLAGAVILSFDLWRCWATIIRICSVIPSGSIFITAPWLLMVPSVREGSDPVWIQLVYWHVLSFCTVPDFRPVYFRLPFCMSRVRCLIPC